jgi:hypothetical protein
MNAAPWTHTRSVVFALGVTVVPTFHVMVICWWCDTTMPYPGCQLCAIAFVAWSVSPSPIATIHGLAAMGAAPWTHTRSVVFAQGFTVVPAFLVVVGCWCDTAMPYRGCHFCAIAFVACCVVPSPVATIHGLAAMGAAPWTNTRSVVFALGFTVVPAFHVVVVCFWSEISKIDLLAHPFDDERLHQQECRTTREHA